MVSENSGKVAWYDEVKGYGFIKQDNGGKDLFVHFRDVIRDANGDNVLIKDQEVMFDVEENEKGPVAKNVKVQ